jgi:hypothetical protein
MAKTVYKPRGHTQLAYLEGPGYDTSAKSVDGYSGRAMASHNRHLLYSPATCLLASRVLAGGPINAVRRLIALTVQDYSSLLGYSRSRSTGLGRAGLLRSTSAERLGASSHSPLRVCTLCMTAIPVGTATMMGTMRSILCQPAS